MAKRKPRAAAAVAHSGSGEPTTVAASNRLADLAGRIREAEAGRASSSLAAAERALEAGRLLNEAKDACPHGEWLPFLALAGLAERQAQRLMLLARSGLKPDTVSDLGMRAALDLAALRRLPGPGEVLALSLGSGEGPGEAADAGAAIALVWQAAELPGHFHVVGWRDAAGDVPAELAALARPIAGERVVAVFAVVDAMLGGQVAIVERLGGEALAEAGRLRAVAMGGAGPDP